MTSGKKDNENALEVSYYIAYCIAKYGKNYTIAKYLISPFIKDAVFWMFGEEHVHKINTISIPNNTMSWRIQDMSDDVETVVVDRIRKR